MPNLMCMAFRECVLAQWKAAEGTSSRDEAKNVYHQRGTTGEAWQAVQWPQAFVLQKDEHLINKQISKSGMYKLKPYGLAGEPNSSEMTGYPKRWRREAPTTYGNPV